MTAVALLSIRNLAAALSLLLGCSTCLTGCEPDTLAEESPSTGPSLNNQHEKSKVAASPSGEHYGKTAVARSSSDDQHDETRVARSDSDPSKTTDAPSWQTPAQHTDHQACQKLWNDTLKSPPLPGAPNFERQRATLLSRAKAEPVLFTRAPRWSPASSATVSSFRKHLAGATHHWDVLRFQLARFLARPDIGREVLLKDGYLYSEHPHMAYAMDQQVKPEHLFDAERIWIQRGQHVYHARRTREGTYVYEGTDAAEPQPVTLLYLDRLGVGAPPEPLHVDVRDLRRRLSFDRLRVVHLSKERLLVELFYEDLRLKAVLRADGARLDVVCEIAPAQGRAAVQVARRRGALRQRGVLRLQRAMHDQVLDGLPFDEPRNEVGTQDGALRRRWQRAYDAGRDSFALDGQRYAVFNALGRARPPQVCVDFITDTLERAGGSWFNPRGQDRERSRGNIDLSAFELLKDRRVPNLLRFVESESEWFDVYTTDPAERIPLGLRRRFFRELARDADRYRAGDIVIVRGFTESDPEHMHYHSFFIYETDPISGVPIAIVGNSGYPHIWSLEDESRRAPKRSVQHRIRLRLPLLEKIAGGTTESSAPVPLVEEAI